MSMHFGSYDQYVLAGVVLAGTTLAVVVLLWLTQRSPWAPRLKSFHGIAQNFLTVINVIFALNLAFLANDTWSARDRALNAVFREAASLRTICDTAEHLPPSARSEVVLAIRTYAEAIVRDEWPMLARRESSPAAADMLRSLLVLLSSKEVTSALPATVAATMLQHAAQLREERSQRIALSQTHVNPLKWLGMAFLGFVTMISIAMVHVDQSRAECLAVVLFAIAAAPTAAIILIHGNPFQHPFAVSPAPIARVLDSAAADALPR